MGYLDCTLILFYIYKGSSMDALCNFLTLKLPTIINYARENLRKIL